MKDEYAGAAWNQLMENETKESIAEMLLDTFDENRRLRGRLKVLEEVMEGKNDTTDSA